MECRPSGHGRRASDPISRDDSGQEYIDLDPSGEKIFVRYEQGVLGDYRVGSPERAILEDADLLVAPHYEQIAGFFDSVMNTPSRGLRAVDFADIAQHPSTANVRHYSDRFDIAFLGLSRNEGRSSRKSPRSPPTPTNSSLSR